MDDWRVDNAKWTRGAVLRFQKYARPREDWDHDHCEGCWAKFMESGSPKVLTEGYVAEDQQSLDMSRVFPRFEGRNGMETGLDDALLSSSLEMVVAQSPFRQQSGR